MNSSFYNELSEMANEALQALNHYETTGNTGPVFETIRAVASPCLDGRKINQAVKRDLPLRDQHNFEMAILSISNLFSLSGGREENKSVRSLLEYVKNKTQDLASKTTIAVPEEIKVFYSWQAQLPNKTNRGLIKDSLGKAIKEINKDVSIESRVSMDSDTSNTPGSPDIINTILEKIDLSSVFIADVSFIKDKQPNSNVMFELGYAMKALGDNKIIMIFNENFGDKKYLPFDLGFKRQIIYSCSKDSNIPEQRKQLMNRLKSSVKLILPE